MFILFILLTKIYFIIIFTNLSIFYDIIYCFRIKIDKGFKFDASNGNFHFNLNKVHFLKS